MSEDQLRASCHVADPRIPWDVERPREAEASFRAELDALRRAGGDPGRIADLMTQLARAQGLLGQLDQAQDTLAATTRLLVTVTAMAPRLRHLLEQGRLLVLQRFPDRARLLLMQAFEGAQAAGDTFLAIDAAQMMSLVEPPKQQMAWLERALALATAAEDPAAQRWLAALELASGWRWLSAERCDRALACFTRSVEHAERHGDARAAQRGRHARARALRGLGRFEEALAIQQVIHAAQQRAGRPDGRVVEELAECLQGLARADAAQPYFAEAHALLSREQWLVDNQPARLTRLKRLSKPNARS